MRALIARIWDRVRIRLRWLWRYYFLNNQSGFVELGANKPYIIDGTNQKRPFKEIVMDIRSASFVVIAEGADTPQALVEIEVVNQLAKSKELRVWWRPHPRFMEKIRRGEINFYPKRW
jgi:hypothetical protein